MSLFRITYNSINVDLTLGRAGLVPAYTQQMKQNRSGSGKIEQINQHGIIQFDIDMFLGADTYREMLGWWSWARQGKTWALALDSANIANTTLDGAAAAAQKIIPLTATTSLAVGDYCLIRAADNDDEFELVKIASVSAGVSVTAVDNLVFSYASGDTFRHRDYFPNIISLEKEYKPRPIKTDLYSWTLSFVEIL